MLSKELKEKVDKILMKLLVVFLFTFTIAFSQTSNFEEQKMSYLEEVKGYISRDLYKKIREIKFEKYIDSESTSPFSTNFKKYYTNLQQQADHLYCESAEVPTSIAVEYVSDFFKSLNVSLVKYSDTIPCNQSAKDVMSLDELNEISNKLENNNDYNNDHPNGACFSRTYLISKELNDLGFKSKQLQIAGWILGSYQKGKYYGVEGYPIHKANLVKVNTPEGIKEYVIDPMYLDAPIPLDEYKNQISNKNVKNEYRVLDQDDNESLYTEESGIRKNLAKQESCSYNAYLLQREKDLVKQPASEFYYKDRHKKISENKYLSRSEALLATKVKIEE